MIRLDGQDIGILVSLWEQGCRSIELGDNLKDTRRRLYKMRQAGLCGCSPQFDCDGPGHHRDPIWGINPAGKEAVNLSEKDYAGAWSEPGFSMEFTPEIKEAD